MTASKDACAAQHRYMYVRSIDHFNKLSRFQPVKLQLYLQHPWFFRRTYAYVNNIKCNIVLWNRITFPLAGLCSAHAHTTANEELTPYPKP